MPGPITPVLYGAKTRSCWDLLTDKLTLDSMRDPDAKEQAREGQTSIPNSLFWPPQTMCMDAHNMHVKHTCIPHVYIYTHT